MDNNGVQTLVATTSQQVSETKDELTAEDKSGKETTYQLTLKNQKAAKATSVNFAVWSERNDQDDLVWYEGKKTSSNTWSAEASIKNHKTAGKYLVHVYGIVNGQHFL